MKKKLFQLSLLICILSAATSCKKALEDALSREIPVTNKSVTFDVTPSSSRSADGTETRSGKSKEVLYDGVLEINIAQELEKQGLSFENLKSFLITQGTIEEDIPSGYDLQGFIGMELYFDNRTKLVAKVEKVEGNKARFTIVNGELLDKLKEDKLHIILVGVRPARALRLKLTMDYRAKVSLIK